MSFPTDWDLDYYKTDYESEEHWELRRLFMETHKSDFPEDELVCLAQVFTNVEFMGCRYPERTMQKVALLSRDVAADFRKKRASKLKRTFVGAKDAAEMKAKRTKNSPHLQTQPLSRYPISFIPCTASSNSTSEQLTAMISKQGDKNKRNIIEPVKKLQTYPSHPNKFNNLIIYQSCDSSTSTIQTSCAKQRVPFRFEYENVNDHLHCKVYINNILTASAADTNKQAARTSACDKALTELRKCCYTIKPKIGAMQSIAVATQNEPTTSATKTGNCASGSEKLNEQNKGFQMMKLLGWTGGGLGADQSGHDEPITVQVKLDRKGLGLAPATKSNEKLNDKYFYNYLNDFVRTGDPRQELVFSKDFTKEERATLHSIARKLNLRSKSKNTTDGDRFLIVSMKIELGEVLNDILNNGCYGDVFDIIPPNF